MNDVMKSVCQCGDCQLEISGSPFVCYACHCTACQRLSGSAFQTCAQFASESIRPSKGALAQQVRKSLSGNELTTFFCSSCSSALYSVNSARPRIATVYVGCLESASVTFVRQIEVNAHIWISEKMDWVVLPAGDRLYEHGGDWTEDYQSDLTRYLPVSNGI